MRSNKTSFFSVQNLTYMALFTALIFISNYFYVPVTLPLGTTRLHLGNIFVLLAGFYLGGGQGGLAAGLGAGMFDLFSPGGIYIADAPVTFVFRFTMAFTAGWLSRRRGKHGRDLKWNTLAAVAAAALYIILYMMQTYVKFRLLGGAADAAMLSALQKGALSTVNGAIGVLAAVPLSLLPLPKRKP